MTKLRVSVVPHPRKAGRYFGQAAFVGSDSVWLTVGDFGDEVSAMRGIKSSIDRSLERAGLTPWERT